MRDTITNAGAFIAIVAAGAAVGRGFIIASRILYLGVDEGIDWGQRALLAEFFGGVLALPFAVIWLVSG